jgi:hypothetical protein
MKICPSDYNNDTSFHAERSHSRFGSETLIYVVKDFAYLHGENGKGDSAFHSFTQKNSRLTMKVCLFPWLLLRLKQTTETNRLVK